MEAVLPWRAAKYLKPGAVLIRMNDMTKDSKWSRGVTGWGDGPRFLFVSLRGKCHGEKDYQFIAVRPEGHPAHRTYTMPVHWFCTEETHKALLEMGIDVTRWDATPKEGATP